jgi:hypothetical protein
MEPPITGTPLDYVPVGTPADWYVQDHDVDNAGHKRGSKKYRTWKDPDFFLRYAAPTLKRALTAAIVAAVVVGFVYAFPAATAALTAMVGSVWLASKWADRLNAREQDDD